MATIEELFNGLLAEHEKSREEMNAELAMTKVITEKFMDWVHATPELEGHAVMFGCSRDGDATSAICGGQREDSPAYDRIAMRLIYNIENRRLAMYRQETVDTTVDRGHDHGALE